MRISTKGRYGTRAMLALAGRYGSNLMRATEISEEQGISLKYLEAILASLRAAGLIVSVRGKNGGYALSRSPEEITLHDVINPLEGAMEYVHCLTDEGDGCERIDTCVTRTVWAELKQATDRILRGTTLADLVERGKALRAEELPDSEIPSSRELGCPPGMHESGGQQ